MTAVDWWNVAAMIGALFVALLCIAYTIRTGRKSTSKFVVIALCFYMAGLYALALTTELYLIRSGILTRIGVLFLLAVIAVDVIADWRDPCRQN